MAVDRLERLTNLVAFLLHTPRPVSLAEVVEQVPGYPPGLDARRQAFERDKRLLRDERIPIVEDAGRYRIRPADYYLPALELTEAERLALHVAVAAVGVSPGEAAAGLQKLGGSDVTDGLAPPPPVRAELVALPALPLLHGATRDRSVVEFTYGGEPRRLEPYGLLFRGGHWYVVGHDRAREARRTFRVDRIEGEVVVGPAGAFERPPTFDMAATLPRDPWLGGPGGEEAVTATVWVDALLAGRVQADLGGRASAERQEDGSVLLGFPVTNRQVFRSWLLGLLDHAEVVAPEELRAEIVSWLQAMAMTAPDGPAAP